MVPEDLPELVYENNPSEPLDDPLLDDGDGNVDDEAEPDDDQY